VTPSRPALGPDLGLASPDESSQDAAEEPMGARTTAREAALQMLFALDSTGAPAEEVIRDYWREMPGDAEGRSYADELVRGVASDLAATDALIRAASTNWRLERMNRVDRNLLRLGAYELAHRTEVPRAVILDEAVEIAKRYGTDESSAFVNGVLDRVADDCGRVDADRDSAVDQS
jgi:transcription antitermination protein NusB